MFYCFKCKCGATRDSVLSVSERKETQLCSCGLPMIRDFQQEMRGARSIVYANDSIHGAQFTGPRQRDRWLKDNNLIDGGQTSADGARWETRLQREAEEEKLEREIDKGIGEAFQELGDHMFTTDPAKQVSKDEPKSQVVPE